MKPSDGDQPVLTPAELLAYRRARGVLPEFIPPLMVIFAPQKYLADYVLRHHSTKRIRGFFGEFYLLKRTKGRIALSTGFGIGAPVTAGLADEFSALGARQFVLIGMAGGLQPGLNPGSLVICTSAVRGEGVSHHYLPLAETVESSDEMARGVGKILEQRGQPYSAGLTWTTDAPFRERRKDVLEYQSRGVLAVDMEAAALLSVASAHGLPALAVFSISDTLANGTWSMPDDPRPAQHGLSILFDSVLSYMTELL